MADTLKVSSDTEWFVYIIECADGRLYTGITTDVERRFDEHVNNKTKGAKALRGKGPLKLVFFDQVADRSEASVIECYIKKMRRNVKLNLIRAGSLVDVAKLTSL